MRDAHLLSNSLEREFDFGYLHSFGMLNRRFLLGLRKFFQFPLTLTFR